MISSAFCFACSELGILLGAGSYAAISPPAPLPPRGGHRGCDVAVWQRRCITHGSLRELDYEGTAVLLPLPSLCDNHDGLDYISLCRAANTHNGDDRTNCARSVKYHGDSGTVFEGACRSGSTRKKGKTMRSYYPPERKKYEVSTRCRNTHSRMQHTVQATRRKPHGGSRLAMCEAVTGRTRRSPSGLCTSRDMRPDGVRTTECHAR